MNKLPNNITGYRKQAFTLIELLVVMAVLGVLASIIVVRFTGVQASARDAKRQSELKQYQTSLEVYANKNNVYPSTSSEADALCSAYLGIATGCPDDPVTTQHYQYIGNASDYVLWATLERKNAGATEYFILCSNGKVGKRTDVPTSAACPL